MRAKLNLTVKPDGTIHAASVTFTTDAGNDGRMVSLAFDERGDHTVGQEKWVYSEYFEYTDTPVMHDDRRLTTLTDLPILLAELIEAEQPIVPVAVDDMPWGV